ncbi:flagellar basal body P-ring formation chaperone FlgA [Castellaniella sp.]|uniref:flagellar basal body P-ring formation chaperone FlgA n=1 Tax=Castellaniella sp. TaxID=1955812 RepID=UPI0025BC838E|nr:flagellar basal body P-ring formation chaperone FlgA [Castellaniella sp.]
MPVPCLLAALLLALSPALSLAQTPAAARQDPAALVARAQAMVKDRAASYPGRAVISVTPPPQFNQPVCNQLEAFLAGNGGLQPRTSVGIRCLAPHPWTTYLQASVQIMGPYFVASHTIQRGEAVNQDDLETREGDLLRNRRLVSDPSRVVGWIATRNIRAGGAIESSALRDPNAIQRGQQVRTVARGAGFVATSEGRAMDSGGPGTQIQVRTPSGQIVTGTVIDGHTVQVMM